MITHSQVTTNLTITHIGNLNLYFSCSTLIAFDYNNTRLRIDEAIFGFYFSRTTTRHLKKFGIGDYYKVSPETLQLEALSIIRTQVI